MANLNEMLAPAPAAPLSDVTPTAMPGAPAPAATMPKADKGKGPDLPAEVQNNKVVKEVLQGTIPGVVVRPDLYYPKAQKIAESWEDLMAIGLDFFFVPDGSTVLFNPAKISEQELQKAAEQGMINKVLPDWETLSGERPQKPPKGANLSWKGNQGGAPLPAPPAAPGALPATNLSPVPQAGGNLDQKLATARVANVNVANAGPTTGPVPGGGRVLNAAATPAV